MFSKCLSNPLTIGDGCIPHFKKILPFILKARVLLLSLHLYTKTIMRVRFSINVRINRNQIGGIDGDWASPKRHQKLRKFAFFTIKLLVTFKKVIRSQGINKHSVKIVFVAKITKMTNNTYLLHISANILGACVFEMSFLTH